MNSKQIPFKTHHLDQVWWKLRTFYVACGDDPYDSMRYLFRAEMDATNNEIVRRTVLNLTTNRRRI